MNKLLIKLSNNPEVPSQIICIPESEFPQPMGFDTENCIFEIGTANPDIATGSIIVCQYFHRSLLDSLRERMKKKGLSP